MNIPDPKCAQCGAVAIEYVNVNFNAAPSVPTNFEPRCREHGELSKMWRRWEEGWKEAEQLKGERIYLDAKIGRLTKENATLKSRIEELEKER